MKILSLLVLLLPIGALGQDSFMVGKWAACTDLTTGDEKYTIDSSKFCDAPWIYEFEATGQYKENSEAVCNGRKYQVSGEWSFDGEKLKISSKTTCGTSERTYRNIIRLSKNLWYTVATEIADGDQSLYVHCYFSRVD